MEVYTNATLLERTITVPFNGTPTSVDVFVYRDDEFVFEITEVVSTPAGFAAVLPIFLTQFDSELKVNWTFTYLESNGEEYNVTKVTPVYIVTPILTKQEVRAIDPQVFATDAEYYKIEKAVRHVIQAYTGQEFGHYLGTYKVKGDGGEALFLPRRLIELESVNGLPAALNYLVDAEGYIVRHYPWGVPPVKADFDGLHMHVGGVIHNPNSVKMQAWGRRTYELKGRWGWEVVPAAVKEAAKLLVNDYACADSQYRDRYLTSMTAADWRIQFNSGAFARTGNVRADQLLSDYVITRGWGVI